MYVFDVCLMFAYALWRKEKHTHTHMREKEEKDCAPVYFTEHLIPSSSRTVSFFEEFILSLFVSLCLFLRARRIDCRVIGMAIIHTST